jgi:dephospho-CoA kinase
MKLVVGLTGSIGAGKSAIADHLCKKYGAKQLRFSQILMDILDRLYLEKDRKNLQTLGIALRKAYGDDVIANAFEQDLRKCKGDIVIVDGIRYMSEVEMMRKFDNNILFYAEAPEKLRYERTVKRGEKGEGTISFEEFLAAEKRGTEKNLPEIKKAADIVLQNSGTVDELFKRVDKEIDKKIK